MTEVHSNEEVLTEGLARIIVPRLESYVREDGKLEPAWMPVFYNPEAALSRDITVLYLSTRFKHGLNFIDALAGTGVRGVRISLELEGEGVLNDVDPRAFHYIRRNIALNNLESRVQAFNQEANTLLNMLTFTGIPFDFIDIDPYGSPIPYVDSAFKPLGKKASLGVTATDTAPLTCSNPRKMLRRYWHRCVDVDFEKEVGLRVLISNIVLRGAAHDIMLKPAVSFLYKHYYRVVFETVRNASLSFENLSKCIGSIWYCTETLERGFAVSGENGIACMSGKPVLIGPLWVCELMSSSVVNDMLAQLPKYPWMQRQTVKMLKILAEETSVQTPYIRVDRVYSRLRKNMPPFSQLMETLKQHGFKVARTHFDPRGIRVDGDLSEAFKIMSTLGR
ncbi:RsmD family RNA methyltransferase [Thermosphaera chiliense]|uniref:tRNA (guanine(26)-N(2))-dimethyltransferase n=1 Tax=Thermosphaera chiliense TaxID=3402707 RepID=A0A7M1UPV6_9CREN|nr:RsmD family RNA methyltransferase [Thermosphaera aggregans]